jgi:hypothetical protein
MHRDYVGLISGAASLCVLIGCLISFGTMTDEHGRPVSEGGRDVRERLRTRYRAHPAAVRLQAGCLIAALALLVVAGVNFAVYYNV